MTVWRAEYPSATNQRIEKRLTQSLSPVKEAP